ncbi:hypothetical protein TMPK1_13280 [Rhodospirillales bacterium TMPK1]|uniref:Uncharacterized protein n=1 Tax=Roseiterribacter gracilis TaxID=2812848 RepID=A0A8S8XB65_9PROT|nr:hypothetical protein TMPK1_13280 [Rhodospirillales bacterium TMPK1]
MRAGHEMFVHMRHFRTAGAPRRANLFDDSPRLVGRQTVNARKAGIVGSNLLNETANIRREISSRWHETSLGL